MSQSEPAGSYGSCNYLKNLYTVFHSISNLYSNDAQEFLLLHINTCYLSFILCPTVWVTYYCGYLLQQLVMLNTFSCTCWTSCDLWETVYSNFLPILKSGCWVFAYEVCPFLYPYLNLPLIKCMIHKYFSISEMDFTCLRCVDDFLCHPELFLLIDLILFLFSCALGVESRESSRDDVKEIPTFVLSLRGFRFQVPVQAFNPFGVYPCVWCIR